MTAKMTDPDNVNTWPRAAMHELCVLDCVAAIFKKHFHYSPFEYSGACFYGDTFQAISASNNRTGLFIWRNFKCKWSKTLDRDSVVSRPLSTSEMKELLDSCIDEIMRASNSATPL